MANDREILREIWDGKIPVCFQLDSSEVLEMQQPEPFYLMVPRLSYFPLVTDKVTLSATYSVGTSIPSSLADAVHLILEYYVMHQGSEIEFFITNV